MAIVAEYEFENAIVRIWDDYIEKDPTQRKRILDHAWSIIDNARLRNAQENGDKNGDGDNDKHRT